MLLWMQIKRRCEGRQGAAGADYRDPAPPRLDVSARAAGARWPDSAQITRLRWPLPGAPAFRPVPARMPFPAERRRAAAATRRDGRTD
jgi:hypothetical protein